MKPDRISLFVEKHGWLSLSFFLVLGLLIYSNTFRGPFVLDDERNIQNNLHIRLARFTLDGINRAALESPSSNRPVANISFALNYYLHQYNTVGYHLVNILIHITTGILLYLFVRTTLSIPPLSSMYGPYGSIPFFAALIWLVHPIQTQSVTYIVQRMNSMSAMFYVLSFLLYAKARLAEEKRKKWVLFVGSSVGGILALGSKEIAATLPLFIFLYELYFFQNLSSSWLKRHLVYVTSTFIVLGLVLFLYMGPNPFNFILSTYAGRDFTLTERVLTQFRVVVYYVTLLAYPHPSRLNLDPDFPLSHSLTDPLTTLLSAGTIVGMIGLALLRAKRDRLLSFCILWFIGNLVIESSVLGLEIMFEHRTYLPSMFVILMAVTLGYRYVKLEWARIVALCGVVIVCSLWTYERNSVWADDVALGRDSVEKSPNKARPHISLGVALYKKGELDEAIVHYSRALRINSNYSEAHNGLGAALLMKGKFKEAIPHFSRALEIDPDTKGALENLQMALQHIGRPDDEAEQHNLQAIALAGEGKLDEAVAELSKALRLRPEFAEAHYNMGNALAGQDKSDEAIDHFSEAIRIKPDYAEARNNLGILLAKQGKLDEAIVHFSEAVRIKPDFAGAKNNLKRALRERGKP
jgi:tetratricopeptide (TPR) repeat protein